MSDYYGLVVGHNETPVALHLLSAPLFSRYELLGTIDDDWLQPQVIAGDRTRKLIGRSRARWTLAACELAEVEYLHENLWTAQTVAMTMRMPNYNLPGHPFNNFNVIAHWLDYSGGVRQFFRNGLASLTFDFERMVALEEA
jgi:hypothetical protein